MKKNITINDQEISYEAEDNSDGSVEKLLQEIININDYFTKNKSDEEEQKLIENCIKYLVSNNNLTEDNILENEYILEYSNKKDQSQYKEIIAKIAKQNSPIPPVQAQTTPAASNPEYNQLYAIAQANHITLPNPSSQNPIQMFFEADTDVVSNKIKESVKRELYQLADPKFDGEKKGQLIKKLSTIFNHPGWGAATDKGVEYLNTIINGKETREVALNKINTEIARIRASFQNSTLKGMEYITEIFVQHYKADLIDRYFALNTGNKYIPKPFPPICLDGPPGTGKTSIAREIAAALHLAFHAHGLEKNPDIQAITGRGSGWTDGGEPGLIAAAKCKPGEASSLVLMLIDEIEKGTPAVINALGSPLAVKTDTSIKDEYFDDDISTRGIYFLLTSNGYDLLEPHIKSRVQRISVPGYSNEQKINIVNTLAKRAFNDTPALSNIKLDDNAAKYLVENYSYEPGARELDLMFDKIKDFAKSRALLNNAHNISIADIDEVLKGRKLNSTQTEIISITEQYIKAKTILFEAQDKLYTETDTSETEQSLHEKRLNLTKIGNQLLSKYSTILGGKQQFPEEYKKFIAESKQDVEKLTSHHHGRILKYQLAHDKLTDHEKSKLKQERLLLKITELTNRKNAVLLNIQTLEDNKTKASYSSKSINTTIQGLSTTSKELGDRISLLNDQYQLELIKNSPIATQKEHFNHLIPKFNQHLIEAQKAASLARLTSDPKTINKTTKRLNEITDCLNYMQNNNTVQPLNPEENNVKDQTPKEPTPTPLPPINDKLKQLFDKLKVDTDLKTQAKLNADYIKHLQYKQPKIDKSLKPKDKTFGGLDQKLEKFHEKYPANKDLSESDNPNKNLENLQTEKSLYLGWTANPYAGQTNQVTISNADKNKSFSISRIDNNSLNMSSQATSLDDTMITQMVESQKRAGNTVITVDGLCIENQDENTFKLNLIKAKKFYDAAIAIGIKIKFDDTTYNALRHVFNIENISRKTNKP